MTKALTAPTFPDPEQTQAARWLNALLVLTFFVVSGGLLFFFPFSFSTRGLQLTSIFVPLFLLSSIFGAWLLMRRGSYRPAAFITIAALFIIPTYLNLAVYQTIHSPDVWVYFILIPLTGLLLGRRYMLYFTLICLLAVAILFLLESRKIITPTIGAHAEVGDFTILLISLALNTILLYAIIRKTEDKTSEARDSLQALMITNRQLEHSQSQLQYARDELELRVTERTRALQSSNQMLHGEIVERQRLMEALQLSEANWRSLVENAPERIATVSIDGTIVFINRAFRNYSAEGLRGMPVATLHTAAEDIQNLQNAMVRVLAEGKPVSYESTDHDETMHVWRINRLGPIYQDGVITAIILISTDITEQKQAEMAMLHSQKLESLGIMAGGVAHDFNNLLTAMVGQATLALKKIEADPHATQNHLQNILLAGHRATDLTRQMLNYAGRSSTDFQSIELNRLIQENVQFFSASIPKSVQLHAVQVQNLPYITGDAGQIQQLLMNLILNAADAIGEHAGTITVTTALHTLGASATGQWQWSGQVLDAGNYVALEVADTGCGMDSETLNKIFDPFFTTKFTGRGLGLASVLGIVRAHGGGLTVDSTPGIGTTFRILFPVATDGGFSVTEDVAVAMPSNSFKGTRVLIIDDERDVRQVTSEILEMSDIETLQAANGRIGLNLFQQYMDEIDLVLLDLSMPEMSGEEVAQALGHLKPDVNIILLSGYDEHEVSRRLGITHQISFLQKPYTMDGLLNAIQQQLAKTKSQPKVVAKKQAMPF